MSFNLPPEENNVEDIGLPKPLKSLEHIFEELAKEFPPEALSVDDSRGFPLTSIKAQYVVERLNDVLTPLGWSIDGGYEHDVPGNSDKGTAASGGVMFFGYLTIDLNPLGHQVVHKLKAMGYAPNKKNKGDMVKSAMTDALTKAASRLGVGNSVFKGLVTPPVKNGGPKSFTKPASKASVPETFKGKTANEDKPVESRASRRSR